MKRAQAGCSLMMRTMSSPLKLPEWAQEGLFGVVVVVVAILEEPVVAADGPARQLGLDGPAGEGAGALADVNFGVIADAHAEQLQQLAAPVLVDRVGVVLAVVQPVNHSRVFGHFHQQFAEVAHALLAELDDHVHDVVVVVNLGDAGGEDAVPEESHLLFQGALRVNHVVEPFGGAHAGQSAGPPGPGVIPHHFVAVQRGLVIGVEQFFQRWPRSPWLREPPAPPRVAPKPARRIR